MELQQQSSPSSASRKRSANPLSRHCRAEAQINKESRCQTTLPIYQRVRDLVSRLTLDEKIAQLVNSAPAILRLGSPANGLWWEALHGVSGYGYGIMFNGRISSANSFPQGSEMGERAGDAWGRPIGGGAAQYAVSYVREIYGDTSKLGSSQTAASGPSACCKHFTPTISIPGRGLDASASIRL